MAGPLIGILARLLVRKERKDEVPAYHRIGVQEEGPSRIDDIDGVHVLSIIIKLCQPVEERITDPVAGDL